ncbi:MAG: hypothetical protein GYA14_01675 [Ignavibacteria bacterium]|nr:hypothetical protein [Ignavibacteria bacterium]
MQILHILKYKLLIFIRLNTRIDLNSLLKNLGSSVIYIGFAVGAFFFTKRIIWFLISEIKIGLFLLHEFMSIVLFIFFVSINVGNIIVSYSTLYKSNEVNYLFTKPVNPSKIFILKFLDNFFYSSSTLLLILLSVLAGYVSYFQMKFSSLLLLFFGNFVPFMLSAGSLGVIILMLLIKLASKINPKRVIYGFAFIYLLFIVVFFNINSPLELANSVFKYYPFVNKDLYLNALVPTFIKYMPNSWLAESAFWINKDILFYALPLTILQLVVSIVLFTIAIYLGKKWYFNTWLLNLKLTADYISNKKQKQSFLSFSKKSYFDPITESLFKKDFLCFFREPSQWLHLIVLMMLIIVFLFSVKGIKYVGLGNFYLQTGIYLSVSLFNLLLISTLSLRFIFPLISLEGEAFWKIKSAPVINSKIIANKLFSFGLFILLIGLLLSYFTNYRFIPQLKLMALIISFVATTTIICINLGMGGFFANYKEKNAIRVASSQGASITFLINIAYMLFIVVVIFKPISNYFLAVMLRRSFDFSSMLFSLIPIVIVSSIAIFISIKSANKTILKDF